MTTRTSLLICLCTLSTLTACGTVRTAESRGPSSVDTRTIVPIPSGRGSDENSGVVLAYEFVGETRPTDSTCRWRMINETTNTTYFLTLNSDQAVAYGAMAPGHYKSVRLGCGLSQLWNMEDTFSQGFDVQPGAASSLGRLQFIFRNGELDEVKTLSRAPAGEIDDSLSGAVPSGMGVISGFLN